jgi:hypothetical protein
MPQQEIPPEPAELRITYLNRARQREVYLNMNLVLARFPFSLTSNSEIDFRAKATSHIKRRDKDMKLFGASC